jgi:hypothetical protein
VDADDYVWEIVCIRNSRDAKLPRSRWLMAVEVGRHMGSFLFRGWWFDCRGRWAYGIGRPLAMIAVVVGSQEGRPGAEGRKQEVKSWLYLLLADCTAGCVCR